MLMQSLRMLEDFENIKKELSDSRKLEQQFDFLGSSSLAWGSTTGSLFGKNGSIWSVNTSYKKIEITYFISNSPIKL